MGDIGNVEIQKVSLWAKDYKAYKALQKRAFPPEEQYPFWVLRLLVCRKGIDYLAHYENDLFCGISYTSSTDSMIYVLYLAVNDEIRSKGYGTKILNQLKEMSAGKEVTLNVEPLDEKADNYSQRVRRMEFYMRNGFHDTGYRLVDTTGEYAILSTTDNFAIKEYKKAITQIGMNLYKPKVIKVFE